LDNVELQSIISKICIWLRSKSSINFGPGITTVHVAYGRDRAPACKATPKGWRWIREICADLSVPPYGYFPVRRDKGGLKLIR
jgi:hypothetical protein